MIKSTPLIAAAVLLLCCGSVQAAIVVSPVVVDEYRVSKGTQFEITLFNPGPKPQIVNLDWGWYTLQADGTVELTAEDDRARDYLSVSERVCLLQPESSERITVTVNKHDFTSISPVLFISSTETVIQTHVAVLFALSTAVPQKPLEAELLNRSRSGWQISVTNSNPCHAYFGGEIEVYQNGEVVERKSIAPRLLLAESERQFILDIDPTAEQIVIRSGGLHCEIVLKP